MLFLMQSNPRPTVTQMHYFPPPKRILEAEDDDDILLAAWFMYMTRPIGEVETWTL